MHPIPEHRGATPCVEIHQGGRTLRVTFVRIGDRFAHRLECVRGNDAIVLLESSDEVGESHWPASPPLQDLSLEENGAGRRVVLGVGMAGRSHWSASVMSTEQSSEITWELACRFLQPPARLGSEYLLRTPCTLQADRARWILGSDVVEMHAQRDATAQDASRITADKDRVRIEPVITPALGLRGATARWRYRVTMGR